MEPFTVWTLERVRFWILEEMPASQKPKLQKKKERMLQAFNAHLFVVASDHLSPRFLLADAVFGLWKSCRMRKKNEDSSEYWGNMLIEILVFITRTSKISNFWPLVMGEKVTELGLPYGPKKTGKISIFIEDLSRNSVFLGLPRQYGPYKNWITWPF